MRARSKYETRWGRCRVIISTSNLYELENLEPDKNCMETGRKKKSEWKERFMEENKEGAEEKSLWVIERCSAVTTDYYKWIVSM